MFFGYPIAATDENWLHDCLSEMLAVVHTSIDEGNDPPDWPDIIPAPQRPRLRSRIGLRARLRRYSDAAATLSVAERQQLLDSLRQQNDIANLLSGLSDCEALADLPEAMHDSVRDLFSFAFQLLTELGVRDQHYYAIYTTTADHVCPFCGCEYFDAPGAAREDLDHYLAKSHYPFAAANLCNLVPMGMKCNSRYKLVQDILRDAGGHRRPSFNPYADREIRVSLLRSVPFGGADRQKPDWQIDFLPDSPECVTWDDVFRLRERIQRDVLDSSFHRWLRDFAVWFVKRKGNADLSDEQIITSVGEYAEDMALTGFTSREFLRALVFEMLHDQCDRGHERLLEFMRDLVANAVPQAA